MFLGAKQELNCNEYSYNSNYVYVCLPFGYNKKYAFLIQVDYLLLVFQKQTKKTQMCFEFLDELKQCPSHAAHFVPQSYSMQSAKV